MKRAILVLAAVTICVGCVLVAEPGQVADQGGADISYDLPRDAEVTINILDSKGWIVRELVRGQDQKAGKNTIHWDGCDQMSHPLPPGEYAWKLVHHTGLKANYILSVANSGQPPYRTDDDKGSWGGCHGNPLSVAADDSGLYLTWGMEEGNAVFTKTDYDGRAIFKIHATQGFSSNWAAAVCGDNLYRVERGGQGPVLMKFEAKSGQWLDWAAKGPSISGGKIRLATEQDDPNDPTKKIMQQPQFVAANADLVAVSFPDFDRVAVYKASGEKVKDLAVEKPRGLAFLPDGRLAVCQLKQVTAIDVASGEAKTLITADLDDPCGITVARDSKSVWITDQGTSHQVKHFDFAGKLLRAFGAEGGMPTEGKIDHASFYLPRGIACGADGNLYVTEDSPLRRISRWSPEGKLLREWFGPLGPQKTCWPNLNNLKEMYYQNWGVIIKCDVDLEKKTWYPVAWYKINAPNTVQPYVWERGGRKYLYAETSKIYLYDKQSDRWLVAVDFAFGEKDKQIWTDLNLDGKQSDDELQPKGFVLGCGRLDPRTFSIYGVINFDLFRIEPERIADNGVPVYSADRMTQLTKEPAVGTLNSWYDPFPIYSVQGCEPASDGGVFAAINGGRQGSRSAWDRASWNNLIKFDAQGKESWRAGVHAGGAQVPHGDMRMVFRICGKSHGLVFLNDVEVQVNVYTEDGLFVDALMDSNDMAGGNMPLGPNSLTVELLTGLVADDPKSGNTYFYAGSTEDARVWQITGMDSLQRMAGKVALKTPGPLKALQAAAYPIPYTKPPRKPIWNDGGADGFLTEPEWESATCLPIVEDGVLLAKCYLRYDDNDLWIAAHVWDASPARNTAQNPELAFTTGDCLDLYFGADPVSKAENGAVGDLRLLLVPSGDKRLYNGTAVIFRPQLPEGQGKKPFEFASPVSKFTMDYVAPLKLDNAVSFWRWRSGLGYTCEARIPLAELPELGVPQGGLAAEKRIRFDCGVIYSDRGGNSRGKRAYWQQDSGDVHCVTDLPTEARLYPQLWGTAVIGAKK